MNDAQRFDSVLELLDRVPRPPEALRWTGATADQFVATEGRLGRPLPDDLRDWLSVCNGVIAGPGGLYGVETSKDHLDIVGVLGFYPDWRERGWIPVAGDGNGNHYVLDASRRHLDSDAVFFVDVMEDPDVLGYIVASSLPRFLALLLGRELGERRWPFDREFMAQKDPDLTAVQPPSLLPWVN